MKTFFLAITILVAAKINLSEATCHCHEICPNYDRDKALCWMQQKSNSKTCPAEGSVTEPVKFCNGLATVLGGASKGEDVGKTVGGIAEKICEGTTVECTGWCNCNVFGCNCDACGNCGRKRNLLRHHHEEDKNESDEEGECDDYEFFMGLSTDEKLDHLGKYYCLSDGKQLRDDAADLVMELTSSNSDGRLTCEEFNAVNNYSTKDKMLIIAQLCEDTSSDEDDEEASKSGEDDWSM